MPWIKIEISFCYTKAWLYDFVSSEGNLKIQLCDIITTIRVLCLVVDWYTFKISRDKQSTIS